MTLLRQPRVLNAQSGFTLIEIIAVLVILSILAVVAVPKYFDLQADAQAKAVQGAMAEAVGRVNNKFAKALLGGSAWQDIIYDTSAASLGTNLGDFLLSLPVAADSRNITLKVEGKNNTPVAGASLTRTITTPGAP
jgi:MSHA pilin protein MshA